MRAAKQLRQQTITDEALHRLETLFCVQEREGYLR